jgi:FAD/FMN-containing dehydrogenase
VLLEHFHGAVTRVPVDATAVPHRTAGWNLALTSVWTDPAETGENVAWTRETHAALAPHLDGRRWLNYLGDDQTGDAVRAAYGPNYERLLEVKRAVDPANVFRHNQNIVPG